MWRTLPFLPVCVLVCFAPKKSLGGNCEPTALINRSNSNFIKGKVISDLCIQEPGAVARIRRIDFPENYFIKG